MRRRIFMAVVLLPALAGLVWLASQPQATGPAEGTKLDGPAAPPADAPRDSFCVGTFNIHGCTGADDRRDIDRVADCLKGLDFVALNEVHGPRWWESDNQAALLGRRLGVPWLFAPATRRLAYDRFWQRPAHVAAGGVLAADPAYGQQRPRLSQRRARAVATAAGRRSACS